MTIDNVKSIKAIKVAWASGHINKTDAKRMAQPYIDNINNKAIEIAKKFGKKAKLINFNSIR